MEPGRLLRFGPFELDTRSGELRRGDARIRLQEQPFEILLAMLEHPGDVVTREELSRRLWPKGTFVDFEHSLNAAIKRLRATLGDDADRPRFVETLPRRGYRFVAAVERVGATPVTHPRRPVGVEPSAPSAAAHSARLAVLPFTNLSDDKGQEYFSDGLTDEMITQIGRLCGGRIGVIARWSSMAFRNATLSAREIGQALRADYLLEGSVRREGDRVRIVARLVEASSETHLWAETFERRLTEVLAVQTDVAERIARSLAMELLQDDGAAHHPAPDAAAYQSYLKGRFYWNKPGDEGLEEAVSYFDEALEADPAFAAAHASRARAQISRAEYYLDVPRRALELARAAALRALELDPTLSEAHLALGDVHRSLDWDLRSAEDRYTQAIALNPSSEGAHRAYGVMLAALRRYPEAIREADRALELDPLCMVVGTTAAWVRFVAGDYEAVIARCRHLLDMDPKYGYFLARRLIGAAYLQVGRRTEAVAELESALSAAGDEPVLMAWLAHAKATSGDRTSAAALVSRLIALAKERYIPAYHQALAHVGLGDLDAAFSSLERACVDRDPVVLQVNAEPRFEPLRLDPRYTRLVGRLGLIGEADIQHEAYPA